MGGISDVLCRKEAQEMKLETRRLLAVYDDEGRALTGTIFEGERVKMIDCRGKERHGRILRIGVASLALELAGMPRWFKFHQIDWIEKEAAQG